MRDSRASNNNSSLSLGNTTFALTDAAFALLREIIEERTGIAFDDAKRGILADKLSEPIAANGLTSFLDYYYLLRYDENAEAHWAVLMDRLAVPETFFWRQAEQIEAVANVIAPAHFLAYPGRPLRIWSAGCCTGEEPISLSIALAEAGLLGRYPIDIVATDGSAEMIARARNGTYGERSFRQLPAALKAKYFREDTDERWRPVDMLRKPIRWGVANLAVEEDVKRYAACDVIFCRNVFIYFSDEAIRSTVRWFTDFLSPDGFLFVGAAESLSRLGIELELAEVGDAFTYVRLGRRAEVERMQSRRSDSGPSPVLIPSDGEVCPD